MNNQTLDWLQEKYTCLPCKAGVAWKSLDPSYSKENQFWLFEVLAFQEIHRKCGFDLDNC